MSNIKFQYLYRDAGNYKQSGEVVFSNEDRLGTTVLAKELGEAFLEDGLFIAHQVRIPEIFLATDGLLTSDDHCFHEFDSVEDTCDAPNDKYGRSIREFVDEVMREAHRGWSAFIPQDRLL
jgi:hypothetical protein